MAQTDAKKKTDDSLEPDSVDWEIGTHPDHKDKVGYITFRSTNGLRLKKVMVYGLIEKDMKDVLSVCYKAMVARYKKSTTPPTQPAQPAHPEAIVEVGGIGFTEETVANLPEMKPGETFTCQHCWKTHDAEGEGGTLFYRCNGRLFIAAIAGRNVTNVKPDVVQQ